MLSTTKPMSISQGVQIDPATRIKLLDTDPKGTYGIYAAQVWRGGKTWAAEWEVWLETNGDPLPIPHPDYADALTIWLSDAGVTRNQLDAACKANGVRWHDGM